VSTRVAEQVADAVLYEGYVLYPYRASSPKNRVRWQIGLVTPQQFAEDVGSDPWFTHMECLAAIESGTAVDVRVRCLHIQQRTIEVPQNRPNEWRAVDHLVVDGRPLVPWDEAVASEFAIDRLPVTAAVTESCWAWCLASADASEVVHDSTGAVAARIVRRRQPVVATVRVATEPCGTLVKIRIRIENVTPCAVATLDRRDEAVRQSLASTHAILAIEDGAFVSLIDPPEAMSALAATCVNTNTFPVLVGAAGSRAVILSSPIILYDYPAIAPESQGDLCDGTEIDELLTLRVRTLTDEEKREARATDGRAAQIIDRCEAASPAAMAQLHGAVRSYESFESFVNPADEPPPEADSVDIGGTRIARGSHVRLQPVRVTDSLDICLAGRTGVVSAVYRTLEDEPYVAVTLDDDPFGGEGAKYRRALFFHPGELVPVERGST
jgi:hypothetical protein